MSDVILRIPVSKTVKKEAEVASRLYGFSSLQEAVKKMIEKLSKREMAIGTGEKQVEYLSKRAEKRYLKDIEAIKADRNVYHADSIEDFIEQLKHA